MDKGKTFRALHEARSAFVIPNPWDIGTAKLLASLGFKALATTSAGFAFSRGLPDGAVGFEMMIHHCREMAHATDLPVSADLERGKGDTPESAAETIFAAEAAGLAGCSIEDHSGDPHNPIYDFDLAVERVAAAADAARSLKRDFVFTARAENYLWNRPDLDDTIRRLQAFEAAGADVLYAPGLYSLEEMRTVTSALKKPFNAVMGFADPAITLEQLGQAGVRRVSIGGGLNRVAVKAFMDAAKQMRAGNFGFITSMAPMAEVRGAFQRPLKT